MRNRSGFASLLVVTIIVVAIFGIFVAGGVYVTRLKKTTPPTTDNATISQEASPTSDTSQIPEVQAQNPVLAQVPTTIVPGKPTGPTNASLESVMTPGTPCDPKNTPAVPNPSTCSMDFYFKDNQTAQVTPFMTIQNVNWNVSPYSQYAGGYVFVLRRMGNDTYPSNDWTDELWMYDGNKEGTKVASGQGLTFLVNPNASMIATEIATPTSQLQVIDGTTFQPIVTYNISDIGQTSQGSNPAVIAGQPWTLSLGAWDQAGTTLWSSLGQQASTTTIAFVKLQPQQKAINTYAVPAGAGSIQATNFDKGVFVSTDHPFFFDASSQKSWAAKNPNYTIFMYHLDGSNKVIVGTYPSSWPLTSFKFDWDAQGNLTYTSPTGPQTFVVQ